VSPSTKHAPRSRAPRRHSAEFLSVTASGASTVPFPLILQRRAPQAVRKHTLRALVRVGTLVTADLLTLVLVRTVLRGLGDSAWLGEGVARVVRTLLPHGTLPFLQLSVGVVLGLVLLGSYRSGDPRQDTRTITLGASLGVALTGWSHLWAANFDWATCVGVALAMAGLSAMLVVERSLVDSVVRRVRLSRGHPMRAVVVGATADAARALANQALSDPTEFQMMGFVDVSPDPSSDAIGSVAEIVDVIARWKVDTIVLAGSFDERTWNHLVHVADAAGCSVLTLPGTLMLQGFAPQMVWRRGVPLVQITRPGLRGHHLILKRALDLAVSFTALVCLAPALAAVAIAVKCSSRGPVLFRQVRVGRGGRTFKINKFRSMVVDAEERLAKLKCESVYGDGRLFKMARDPRITRVGLFLRRTSLDELPQLWNVLVGDMSLVGPRPPLLSEVALYDEHHYTRFDMKPGITGPWQVNGRNRITDFEEVLRLETSYMRQWGIGKDLSILAKTLPAVLRMDGAY
jgi:exopolysaccharide biosynthesis polyprenyl glycosylphosphotransferase